MDVNSDIFLCIIFGCSIDCCCNDTKEFICSCRHCRIYTDVERVPKMVMTRTIRPADGVVVPPGHITIFLDDDSNDDDELDRICCCIVVIKTDDMVVDGRCCVLVVVHDEEYRRTSPLRSTVTDGILHQQLNGCGGGQ